MKKDTEGIKLRVQQELDWLLGEHMIPFELTAYLVATNAREHVVRFNDSRIHSFHFCWQEGEDFKAVVRAAILDRVNNMSGPLAPRTSTANPR